MSLLERIIWGIGWSGLSQAIRLGFQFILMALLAHILSPRDFGILAMIAVFTNLIAVIQDLGITSSIVQKDEIEHLHIMSSFWFSMFFSFILAGGLALGAPLIARFYNEPVLQSILYVFSFLIVLTSLGHVPTALLTRELRFKVLAIAEIASAFAGGFSALILAYLGFQYWSLVWQPFITMALYVPMIWIALSWRPAFTFSWDKMNELLHFGLHLTGFNLLNYVNRNIDNLLIGKFLGSFQLGLYSVAYKILLFPLQNISQVLGRVMFPALSKIQHHHAQVRRYYLNATLYISSITFPLMVGIFILADEFVFLVLGEQWHRAVFIVRVLACIGFFQSIDTTVGWIYISQGKTDVLFKWGIFSFSIVTLSFIIGLRWEIEGIALAYFIATTLLRYPNYVIPFRFIHLSFKVFLMKLKPTFFSALWMGVTVYFFRIGILSFFSKTGTFLASIVVGFVSYALYLHWYDPYFFKRFLSFLLQIQSSHEIMDSPS